MNVIRKLFTSRKFVAAVVGVIVSVLVNLVPELAHSADTLTALIGAVVLAFIGGTAWEDAAAKGKEIVVPTTFDEPAIRELLRKLAEAGVEVVFEDEEEVVAQTPDAV